MDLGLRGAKAVVTGASAGIGLACAKALAREGVEVTLVARSADKLAQCVQEISDEYGVAAHALAMDMAARGTPAQLAQTVADAEIFINNAGAIPFGQIDRITERQWRESWDLKVFGYFEVTREILSRMQARGSGVILNVIGIAGAAPTADYIAGSSGNAALIAFTNAIGAASAAHGVRVFGINPGLTRTERIGRIDIDEEAARARDAALPFGRMMSPEELANFAVFCVSPVCSYLSGTTIDLDGGRRYTRSI